MIDSIRKHNHYIRILFLLVTSILLQNCSQNGVSSDSASYFDWPTTSLENVGLSGEYLQQLANLIDDGKIEEVHGIVIVKNDYLVYEKYWAGHEFSPSSPNYHGSLITYDKDTRHNTHSATKSITSALVGIAIDKGFINSIDDSIFDYLPDHQNLMTDDTKKITIRDCLKMASGLKWNEWEVGINSSEYDLEIFNNSLNPIRFLLSKPVLTKPGIKFYYNGATVDLLGYIITIASEQSLETFSKETFFEPLGISNYNWSPLRAMTAAHGDIYITPLDLTKIGYLFLNQGKWNNERIISENYVDESTSFQISPGVTWADGYGYLWWLKTYKSSVGDFDAFRADGWGGQQVIVIRDLDLVVVFTGANYTTHPPCDMMIENFILPSIK